jgi:hypothetical protein
MARPIDPARAEARARGDKRYISVRMCPKGHLGERFVVSTACCKCADIKRAERSTGRKSGRPKAPRGKPKPQAHRIVRQQPPRSINITRPVRAAISDYAHSHDARERSDYLNSLIRNITAKVLAYHDEENA